MFDFDESAQPPRGLGLRQSKTLARRLTMPVLLELDRATIRFGGLTAVSELTLQLGAHDLLGLIGPNGAGKTTVFNLITGVYRPTSGEISFAGQSLVGRKPYQITEHSIARTFQN